LREFDILFWRKGLLHAERGLKEGDGGSQQENYWALEN
jgi:hypothetical protein